MSFITEAELREQWQGGAVTHFEFPGGTRFSPSAHDFINQWKLQVSVGGELITKDWPRIAHYSEDGLPYLASKWKNVQERS